MKVKKVCVGTQKIGALRAIWPWSEKKFLNFFVGPYPQIWVIFDLKIEFRLFGWDGVSRPIWPEKAEFDHQTWFWWPKMSIFSTCQKWLKKWKVHFSAFWGAHISAIRISLEPKTWHSPSVGRQDPTAQKFRFFKVSWPRTRLHEIAIFSF